MSYNPMPYNNRRMPAQGKAPAPAPAPVSGYGQTAGGYVAPTQTYTGHTSSRTQGANNDSVGVGGGVANKMQTAGKAGIKARPDMQNAPAQPQLAIADPSSFAKVKPMTNRPKAQAMAGALRASPATSGGEA